MFPRFRGKFLKWKKELFFNDFFSIIYDGYFNIVLCCFFNYYAPSNDIDKNTINTVISYLLLILLMICVPLVLIFIAVQPIEKLNEPSFKKKWMMAYDGISFINRSNLFYRVWYCLRRLIFISSLYVIPHLSAVQLLVFMYLNLITTLY